MSTAIPVCVRAPARALPSLHQIVLPTPWEIGSVQIYVVEGDPLTLIDTGVHRPRTHGPRSRRSAAGSASGWDVWQQLFPKLHPDTQMRTRMVNGALDVLEDAHRGSTRRRDDGVLVSRPIGT